MTHPRCPSPEKCERCLKVHASSRCDDKVHYMSSLPYPQIAGAKAAQRAAPVDTSYALESDLSHLRAKADQPASEPTDVIGHDIQPGTSVCWSEPKSAEPDQPETSSHRLESSRVAREWTGYMIDERGNIKDPSEHGCTDGWTYVTLIEKSAYDAMKADVEREMRLTDRANHEVLQLRASVAHLERENTILAESVRQDYDPTARDAARIAELEAENERLRGESEMDTRRFERDTATIARLEVELAEAKQTLADYEHESETVNEMRAERDEWKAKYEASEWVRKDSALRTYDGLTTRHDKYKVALEQIVNYIDPSHDAEVVMQIAREALGVVE